MTERYRALMFTPEVIAAQRRINGRSLRAGDAGAGPDRLGPDEAAFIAGRDSFYMATTSANGWPYLQHRGGPPGFLRVLDDRTLAFADYRGNRQYLSIGNLAADDRAALFFMDYPRRARLKMLGRVAIVDAEADPDLQARLHDPADPARPERVFRITVEAFDWNCPQYITPRYTEAELLPTLRKLTDRIAALEAELAQQRGRAVP
jgi:hypothetical protein